MKILKILDGGLSAAASLLKVALLSRRPSRPRSTHGGRLVIMGNGPSLRQVIDSPSDAFMSAERMAVNFAANAPEFRRLCPRRYILADPHFFRGYGADDNVRRLWENIAAADWEMTLHLPAGRRGRIPDGVRLGDNIRVERYNLTPGEGWTAVTYPLFRSGLAMPRPRNVMIPAIMEALRAGYGEIWLVGADHTWHRSLWVDDDNNVVSVQPHFYKDGGEERKRVASEYAGYHLHDILGSMAVAFRSYHEIAAYARSAGAVIYNATPGSMIDAFERRDLANLPVM